MKKATFVAFKKYFNSLLYFVAGVASVGAGAVALVAGGACSVPDGAGAGAEAGA